MNLSHFLSSFRIIFCILDRFLVWKQQLIGSVMIPQFLAESNDSAYFMGCIFVTLIYGDKCRNVKLIEVMQTGQNFGLISWITQSCLDFAEAEVNPPIIA